MKMKRIKGVKYHIRMNRIVPTPFAFFTIILTNPPLVNQKMANLLTGAGVGPLCEKLHKKCCLAEAKLCKREPVIQSRNPLPF